LISKAGDDPAGDAVLIALAQAGVGHVATLRDPARLTPMRPQQAEPTDPADPSVDGVAVDAAQAASAASASADTEPTLDAADVALALRYLTDFEILVAVHASPDVVAEAVSAAAWTGARLVIVAEDDTAIPPPEVPADALVVAASSDESEGIGERIGRYAAALSRGDDAAAAYRELTAVPDS
jgi:hypothetical protein